MASDDESPIIPDVPHLPNAEKLSARLGRANIDQLKRKRLQDEDDEMALFRRVRVRTSLTLPSLEPRPGSPANDIDNQPGFVPVAPTPTTQTTLQDLDAMEKEILDLNNDIEWHYEELDDVDKALLGLGGEGDITETEEEDSDGIDMNTR